MKSNKTTDLDQINNERVATTKLRVAHAIKLIANPIECLSDSRQIDNVETNIAHAVNLLESGNEELKWACAHHKWNDEVCMQIDDACAMLGKCLAMLVAKDDEDYDPTVAGYDGKEALAILGKVIATLCRWFDDEANVSEI